MSQTPTIATATDNATAAKPSQEDSTPSETPIDGQALPRDSAAIHTASISSSDPNTLRASPDRFITVDESVRLKYAKAIWYERYKGNWVPSIFPPTYIDIPSTLLRNICAKSVDKNLMTFNHFARALKYPQHYPETHNYEVSSYLRIYCALYNPMRNHRTELSSPCSTLVLSLLILQTHRTF